MPSSKSAGCTIVRVSDEAFLTMCFSAAEAAVVSPDFNSASYRLLGAWMREKGDLPIRRVPTKPPSIIVSETGREVAGILTGSLKKTRNQTTISVESAMVITALCAEDSVLTSGTSALLLADLAEAARAPMPVASFHSHPELAVSPREVVEHELYAPSKADLDGPSFPHSHVALIITVGWPDKSKSRPADQSNLLSRRIGDFQFMLTGHLPSRHWSASDPALELRIGY